MTLEVPSNPNNAMIFFCYYLFGLPFFPLLISMIFFSNWIQINHYFSFFIFSYFFYYILFFNFQLKWLDPFLCMFWWMEGSIAFGGGWCSRLVCFLCCMGFIIFILAQRWYETQEIQAKIPINFKAFFFLEYSNTHNMMPCKYRETMYRGKSIEFQNPAGTDST